MDHSYVHLGSRFKRLRSELLHNNLFVKSTNYNNNYYKYNNITNKYNNNYYRSIVIITIIKIAKKPPK